MDLALFDFDGILTGRERFPLFVRAVTPPARVAAGSAVLLALVAGYRLGRISGSVTHASIERLALGGLSADAVAAAGEHFAQRARALRLRPFRGRPRLRRHAGGSRAAGPGDASPLSRRAGRLKRSRRRRARPIRTASQAVADGMG
ncbi:MAG: hypothetical protein J0H86_02265 [Xanthomonadaceae bacterium]|nr:hypothetical protein [Xanthomonadaceae bacterium]